MTDPAATFEPHRRRLLGLAYRMLGSVSEAEDAVQDTYLRWHAADRDAVSNTRAFLTTTTTRICLDVLKSARARREAYVGPWLPEPVLDSAALSSLRDLMGAEALPEFIESLIADGRSLLADIERQLEHHVTGRYSAYNRHPVG